MHVEAIVYFFFFFNDTATTEIYTLSLHDALPIYEANNGKVVTFNKLPFANTNAPCFTSSPMRRMFCPSFGTLQNFTDRKSTRLNSSHANISYAVFCLKKKKKTTQHLNQSYTTLLI